jgi:GDP/UDP-N,N'-diacetylbacillosamine 2-epimerase (hydrolysing)
LNKIKNIAVFTSIRSEYGVMVPVLKKLNESPEFNLSLLVGGAHLLLEHGRTVDEIEKDGFDIAHKFPFLFSDNEPTVNNRSMAVLQLQMGDYLAYNRPDLLMIIGDRFELLPVVNSALILNIPIAHLSGGDVTEGAIDNQIRHAVSKMSHIHFTGTENSRNNLIKMGEEDWRIFNTGEPGIDCILSTEPIAKKELYNELGLDENKNLIITCFHPDTINNSINPQFLSNLFKRLLNDYPENQYLVTSSNFDAGGSEINETFFKLAEQNKNIFFVKSLGQKRYYSILRYAYFMLGNSSSGIIEAQSFKLPVINVGNRQQGRERNANVIDVESDIDSIGKAIVILKDPEFLTNVNNSVNIYGTGNCSGKIINVLLNIDKDKLLLKKSTFNQ